MRIIPDTARSLLKLDVSDANPVDIMLDMFHLAGHSTLMALM
jgi:hypothetical protein